MRNEGAIPRFSDCISLRGCSTQCIVGIYPHERTRPQTLCADVDLYLDLEGACASANLRASVNYECISNVLRFVLESGRFQLIETAAWALLKVILGTAVYTRTFGAPLRAASITLTKPDALGEGRGAPSVTLHREAVYESINAQAELLREPVPLYRYDGGAGFLVFGKPTAELVGDARMLTLEPCGGDAVTLCIRAI